MKFGSFVRKGPQFLKPERKPPDSSGARWPSELALMRGGGDGRNRA